MKFLISDCFLTFIGNHTFELDFGDNVKRIGTTCINGNNYFLCHTEGAPIPEGNYTRLSGDVK